MKKTHLTTANSGTYIDPIKLGDRPSKHIATRDVTRISAIEAATGNAVTIKMAPTFDPFEGQETIRQSVQDQQTYGIPHLTQEHNFQQYL